MRGGVEVWGRRRLGSSAAVSLGTIAQYKKMAPGRVGMDADLETLLTKLKAIQVQVGGRSSGQSKEAEARGGRGADRFLDLKETMMDSLKEIRRMAQEGAANPTANPKEQIALDSKIKKALRGLTEDWHDLDGLVQGELRKRKSKHDADELAAREEMVLRLLREIDDVKAAHRAGYADRAGGFKGVDRGLVDKDDCELFMKRPPEYVPTGVGKAATSSAGAPEAKVEQEAITEEQQLQLQAIKDRDRNFDDQISEIGRGVEALADIADAQNEAVKKQNAMLEDLAARMDNVHDHVTNVNMKMKTTLDEVGRSSDKLCVDVMCLLFLIGMIVVMYQLLVSG